MFHLKQPGLSSEESDRRVRETVEAMLEDIKQRGEVAIRELAGRFDNWEGDFVLSKEKKQRLIGSVLQQVKDDILFAHEQVYRFAEAQRDSLQSFEVETHPGVVLGQRVIPVQCAGCYVPGGRYAHAASAIMSVATARAAGVRFVVAASRISRVEGMEGHARACDWRLRKYFPERERDFEVYDQAKY